MLEIYQGARSILRWKHNPGRLVTRFLTPLFENGCLCAENWRSVIPGWVEKYCSLHHIIHGYVTIPQLQYVNHAQESKPILSEVNIPATHFLKVITALGDHGL